MSLDDVANSICSYFTDANVNIDRLYPPEVLNCLQCVGKIRFSTQINITQQLALSVLFVQVANTSRLFYTLLLCSRRRVKLPLRLSRGTVSSTEQKVQKNHTPA